MKSKPTNKLLLKIKSKSIVDIDNGNLLSMDIGNSRIKWKVKSSLIAIDLTRDWDNKFVEFLNGKIRVKAVCICSVNERIEKGVIEILNQEGIDYCRVTELMELQRIVDFKIVKGMGEDRKVGLIGAMSYEKPPLITIDMGTAVTVNVLSRDGKCLGGVILPGAFTQMKSLEQNTWGLRKVDFKITKGVLGLDTSKALSNGIVYGLEGSILNIVNRIKREYTDLRRAKVILTGGGAKVLSEILERAGLKFKFQEDLVLKGIEKLYNEVRNY